MASDTFLGRLDPVDLRKIWISEATSFTPWLARPENLAALGSVVGIDLELEAQERPVGPFRADILCKDRNTNAWVLIENQLERTDHGHLGQLLTYASGLDAVTIIWLAATFTEEHRAALDWLNKITDESFRFFGLEVELWRIGNSPAAPKFNVVSKPNAWSHSIKEGARALEETELSETKVMQRAYWADLNDALKKYGGPISGNKKPQPQSWMTFPIGHSKIWLGAYVEVDVDAVGDGLVVAVLHDEVLVEEADGLAGRRGGEADEEGVEVEQHLAPQFVDGAVALVDDDEVEELGRDAGVVDHVRRLALPRLGGVEGRAFLVAGVELGLALEHRVEPLDGGDDDLGGGIDRVRFEPLDGVERRELARIVGRLEVGELVLGLLAEIAAIHEEEDALGFGELEQAIGDIDGGEGLARAGRHLDQGARIGPGERLFEVADRLRLDLPQPRLVERRQLLEPGAELRWLCHPFRQRLGPRES